MSALALATLTMLPLAAAAPAPDARNVLLVAHTAGDGADDVDASAVDVAVRAALGARGYVVLSREDTNAQLTAARELGLDCEVRSSVELNECWRRVAALARQDAVVIASTADGAHVLLHLLDARADVAARNAAGALADVASLVSTLTAPTATTATAATTPAAAASFAQAAQSSTLPVIAIATVSAGGLAIVSGAAALGIEQIVLADPAVSGESKGAAYAGGLALLITSATLAAGAACGVGYLVLAQPERPPAAPTTTARVGE